MQRTDIFAILYALINIWVYYYHYHYYYWLFIKLLFAVCKRCVCVSNTCNLECNITWYAHVCRFIASYVCCLFYIFLIIFTSLHFAVQMLTQFHCMNFVHFNFWSINCELWIDLLLAVICFGHAVNYYFYYYIIN